MEKKLTVIPPNQINSDAKQSDNSKYRVAAYCRVSTEQEEQLGSFANQITYYTEYINGKEEYQLAGIFSDEGISGTGTRKRAGFRSMIAACACVSTDVPADTLVAGVPAKVVKEFEDFAAVAQKE